MSRKKRQTALWVMPCIVLLFSSFYVLPLGDNSRLLAGFTPEFMGRSDGDLGLRAIYGLKIRTVVISDAVMYKAAYEKKLDVISESILSRHTCYSLYSISGPKLAHDP